MKHYQFFRIKIILLKMNRFAKMKKERIYTLFETLSFFRIKIILLKMNRFAKMKKERIYTLFETLSIKVLGYIFIQIIGILRKINLKKIAPMELLFKG